MSNVLNESAENYLETILILSQKLPVVRSVDIANELGFKKSSVSVAMKNLREKEHIKVDEQGFIHLTPSGLEIANLGFVAGAEVVVLSKIGGNVIVNVKDSRVAVNEDMARHIMV